MSWQGTGALRALLIGHSYVSIEIAQKKAAALARLDDLEIEVVAPQRFVEIGRWMEAEVPALDPGYRLHTLPVALASIRGQRHAYFYRRGLRSIIRRFKPDVIDLWEEAYTVASTQVALARDLHARRSGLVLSPSIRTAKRQPVPFSFGERYVVSRCSYVVGRTAEAVDAIRKKGFAGPTTVIGHGIELANLQPGDTAACRSALDLPTGRLIVFLGRLVADKGVDTLISALPRVSDAGLAIVGDGPDEPSLRRLAARLGVEDRVFFRTAVAPDAVGGVLNAADVVAMPSRVERWGRVAIEALACGRSVVVGGDNLPALVGPHGRVVPPDDHVALAAALNDALSESRDERARRAESGRQYAMSFSGEALAPRWAAVYDESTRVA